MQLKASLAQVRQSESDAGKWVELIKKYAHPTELTAELLNTLIEKIVIHELKKDENGEGIQKIEIYYRFIGIIEFSCCFNCGNCCSPILRPPER